MARLRVGSHQRLRDPGLRPTKSRPRRRHRDILVDEADQELFVRERPRRNDIDLSTSDPDNQALGGKDQISLGDFNTDNLRPLNITRGPDTTPRTELKRKAHRAHTPLLRGRAA